MGPWRQGRRAHAAPLSAGGAVGARQLLLPAPEAQQRRVARLQSGRLRGEGAVILCCGGRAVAARWPRCPSPATRAIDLPPRTHRQRAGAVGPSLEQLRWLLAPAANHGPQAAARAQLANAWVEVIGLLAASGACGPSVAHAGGLTLLWRAAADPACASAAARVLLALGPAHALAVQRCGEQLVRGMPLGEGTALVPLLREVRARYGIAGGGATGGEARATQEGAVVQGANSSGNRQAYDELYD